MLRRLEQIEEEVTSLERKMASLAAKIEQEGQNHEELRGLGVRYEALEQELNDHIAEWEQLSGELEGA